MSGKPKQIAKPMIKQTAALSDLARPRQGGEGFPITSPDPRDP